jgi:predicted DNA binding protein
MIREVILVEVITKSDMSTEKSRGFTDSEKAEKYFIDLLKEEFGELEEEDIEYALDNGYYDSDDIVDGKSVSIKEIILEDD